MEILNIQNWQNVWGVIILIGLPVLFILVTIIYRKRKLAGKGYILAQIIRLFFIPFGIIHLTLTRILKTSEETFFIKSSETIVTMIIVYVFIKLFDYLLFSDNNILDSEKPIPKLGRDVLNIFLFILSTTFVLSFIWGLDLANMLAALGVGSIVLGLALQEPLGNLFNGISLLIATPFKKGDWVDFNGEIGKAVDINWRSVKIHSRFNEEIIIPNNVIAKEKIKNLSRPNKMYAELLKFGFSYDNTPEEVKKVLLDIVKDNDKVLEIPIPTVYTLAFEDFAITYGLKFFVKDFEDMKVLNDEILSEVYHKAAEHNLIIPYPRQDIEMKIKQQ